MTDLILRIALILENEYASPETVRFALIAEGHVEENVFLAMKAADIIVQDRNKKV